MFIELVDALRCVGDHEESWLVAAVDEMHGRHVARGSLGCPVCRATYRIIDGAAAFGPVGVGGLAASRVIPSADEVMRARALLHLVEPGGVVALLGTAAVLGSALEEEAQVTALLINPTGACLGPGVSTLWVGERLPVARGALRGAILSSDAAGCPAIASVLASLGPGARLVAPAGVPLPAETRLLARDSRQWVAEVRAAVTGPMVELQRAPQP